MVFVVGKNCALTFQRKIVTLQKRALRLPVTSISLRDTPHPTFSNRIAFPFLAYFSKIVAVFCMISTDRQHQLVYSISSLKQVRFITTEQDLSLATRFMLSSLESIKCMPLSRESVLKFRTLHTCIPYSIKILKRSSFRKRKKELVLNFLRSEDDYVEVSRLIKLFNTLG